MTLSTATFYYMAFASVTSALLAVTRKNPVHSMLWVLVLFLHVAGIFLLLNAEFLAAVQVIVYAGAILVFYLFVLMLLDLPDEEARPRVGNHWPFAAAVATVAARRTPRGRRWPWAALGTWVPLTRVHLGVHYPSDVLGGAALGWVLGRLVDAADRTR